MKRNRTYCNCGIVRVKGKSHTAINRANFVSWYMLYTYERYNAFVRQPHPQGLLSIQHGTRKWEDRPGGDWAVRGASDWSTSLTLTVDATKLYAIPNNRVIVTIPEKLYTIPFLEDAQPSLKTNRSALCPPPSLKTNRSALPPLWRQTEVHLPSLKTNRSALPPPLKTNRSALCPPTLSEDKQKCPPTLSEDK